MNSPGHSKPCLCSKCSHLTLREPLFSLCDVEFIRQDRVILSDVNFTVDRGDFIAITGPNGGGKTTLLRLILGLLQPSSGKIVHYDSNPFRPGYLPQKNSVDAHFPITVREVVESGLLGIDNISKSERKELIAHALELIQLADLASRPIGRLSGGQLQRALFGRAIVSRPKVLVLDEPLSYIDARFEQRLYEIVSDIAKDATILLVSHQMNEIAAMANRHIIVDGALRECTHTVHFTPPEC